MPPTPQNNNEQSISRVSIFARLVPAFSYAIPMLGAAMSALLLMRVMTAMRYAESAGIAAVAGGMSEATLAIAIALYLGIFVGVIGIVVMIVRSLIKTNTASPSGWFFLITGGLSLIPLGSLWKAESLLIQAITSRVGVVQVAATIQICLTLTLITAAVFALILLVASVVPLPAALRARRSYAPVLVLVLMELALIGMAVAFQIRSSWLYEVRMTEHF